MSNLFRAVLIDTTGVPSIETWDTSDPGEQLSKAIARDNGALECASLRPNLCLWLGIRLGSTGDEPEPNQVVSAIARNFGVWWGNYSGPAALTSLDPETSVLATMSEAQALWVRREVQTARRALRLA
jgi:hypothetical protein